ncbi:heme ABC transporter ATP-binding protein [Arhodomonas aquaeolei]|uniref:heme ABC transporter ATP-binding protein n=1 Tax=Arhodomonas aquaeolei TaxID=2369 RepID=UPI002168A401|nr:heme ABC transporter ATP-binding protein [Arhodomonas aquaeolei]MCS4505118.1 heme ABC transporter ATP-binding protein [Arhodomonas aquaeolei]
MLSGRGIGVARGGRVLLAGVDIAVAPGETVALIGPNGAGKSTLLRVLSGALRPDRGAVSLDDVPLEDWHRTALARRRAVLPQAPALGFALTVREVVSLGRSPHAGMGRRADDVRIVDAALRRAGVAHLAGRAYPGLSGGERQRVQLARVLAQIVPAPGRGEPGGRYLLLDEPTNNLDIGHQQRIVALARRLARRGGGVLAVLHDPNLAAACADRLVVLAGGTVIAAGAPSAVLDRALMREVFGVRVRVHLDAASGRPFVRPV